MRGTVLYFLDTIHTDVFSNFQLTEILLATSLFAGAHKSPILNQNRQYIYGTVKFINVILLNLVKTLNFNANT